MPTIQSELLVEQRVAYARKSTIKAYLLLLFFGSAGAHRFYLGRRETAVGMLALFILSFMYWQFFVAGFVWSTVDGFLIPKMIREHTELLRQEARAEVERLERSR